MTKSKKTLAQLKAGKNTSDHIDHILKRLGHGATRAEIVFELHKEFGVPKAKADTVIDTCVDLVFRVEPEYVTNIVAQIRYNTAQTLQGVDEMLEDCTQAVEREQLIRTRMRAMDTLQKLLPTKIDIVATDPDNIRRILFDLHDVEDESGE